MTDETYTATLAECLALVWNAQLQMERTFDALTACHIAIQSALSNDRLNRVLAAQQTGKKDI